MNNTLVASLLNALNQNQIALGAAVEELSNWVEACGSADIADNVRGALATLDDNLDFIRLGIAKLSTPGSSHT
ncbi:hypothetical protein [Pseudomonas sp. BF-B-28]|uniref:hypothetical protein n=1 Tax=Pseudomonas sp. BF-B-28 TaxID=2832353 RepID=UPI001CBD297E|nr:hypothetical protein [Pseudomonas sp. BF-B-28]